MKSFVWFPVLLWMMLAVSPSIASEGSLEFAESIATNYWLGTREAQKETIDRVFAEQEELSERYLLLEESISELETLVGVQEAKRLLAYRDLERHLAQNSKQLQEVIDEFSVIEEEMKGSFQANRLGSILILIALVFEVPGAILLGGANLANEQPHVFSLSATPDLVKAWSFGYEKVWDRLSFYGLMASLFLIVGFLLQVGGITLILDLPTWVSLLFIALTMIVCGWIVYFLLGQHPDQSRAAKIKVFWLNVKRLFPLTRTERCDYCSGRLTKDRCQIWWVHGRDVKTVHIGHPECLGKSGWYQHLIENETLNKVSISDFFSRHLVSLNKFWEEKRANCPHEKGKKPGGTQYEYEFNSVVAKASRVLHGD